MSVFNIEAIKRFCDGVTKNQGQEYKEFIQHKLSERVEERQRKDLCSEVAYADIAEAAFALSCLVYGGTDLKKELGITKKRGRKKSKLSKTVTSPEFSVILCFVAGEISYTEAHTLLMDEFKVDRTTAIEYINHEREIAREFIESFIKYSSAPKWFKPYPTRDKYFSDE